MQSIIANYFRIAIFSCIIYYMAVHSKRKPFQITGTADTP